MIHYYAGTSIYIPKFSEIERRKRNEKIRIEYDKNGDIKALALKYGLSEIQIRTIIGDLFKNKKIDPYEGQVTLFDLLENLKK
mgnify:CR=1 FL=1